MKKVEQADGSFKWEVDTRMTSAVSMIVLFLTASSVMTAKCNSLKAYAQSSIVTPVCKKMIKESTALMSEKVDVMYKFQMLIAKKNGLEEEWNTCVDEVYSEISEKVGKIKK